MERTTKQLSELDMSGAMPADMPSQIAPSADMPAEPTAGLLPDGSIDNEGAMVKADLFKLAQYSYKLFKKIEDNDQFESWVQAKVTKAADYIASVYHYLEYEMKISEYGQKLSDSDVLSESQKQAMSSMLMEAKDKVSKLKKLQAEKMAGKKEETCMKETSAKNKKFAALAPPKDKITYADKIAGATKSKKVEEAKEEEFVKPRNFVAKNAKATTSGAGVHTDKKKAAKAGDVKHKKSMELDEAKPSAGLSAEKKSATVKAAKAGKDIGKKGPGFEKVEKAAKKSGAKDPKAVAAAAMWKNIKREAVKENTELEGPSQLEQLLAMKQQYAGTEWEPQIDYRINWLKDHLEQSGGVTATGQQLNTNEPVASPEEWAAKHPGEFNESQLAELNLKPWKKESPFSKAGHEAHAERQSGKMKAADDSISAADEEDDESGIAKGNADWMKAKKRKDAAVRKASLAKKESINESAELSVIKMLSGLK
jgi:hypothetical protein